MTADQGRRRRASFTAGACIVFLTAIAEAETPANRVVATNADDVAVPTAVAYQINPFGVGYELTTGYRPVYGGAPQPGGHEIVWTGPNGYVYRPLPAVFYGDVRLPMGSGPLVVEFPGTENERRYLGGQYGRQPTEFGIALDAYGFDVFAAEPFAIDGGTTGRPLGTAAVPPRGREF